MVALCPWCSAVDFFGSPLSEPCLLVNSNEVHVSFKVVLVPLWVILLYSWVIIRLFFVVLVWLHLTQEINMNTALIALDGNCAFLFCFLHFLPRYMPEKWLNKLSVALSHVSNILVCIALSLKYTKVEILFISWGFYMHHRLVCSACFQRQPLIFYATLNHSRHLRDFWPQISYSVSLSHTLSEVQTNVNIGNRRTWMFRSDTNINKQADASLDEFNWISVSGRVNKNADPHSDPFLIWALTSSPLPH